MKKALAILGSPRKNGNAAKMLNIAMESAQQAGYEVTFYNLYETNIGWCCGCMACKASGICVVQDDAQRLRDAAHRLRPIGYRFSYILCKCVRTCKKPV